MLTRSTLAILMVLFSSCSRPKAITVGSKDSTEQRILAEIIAQHLERKLGVPITRRPGMGDTRTTHQALLNSEISLYPEYSGQVVSELLKETPNAEASITWEYARQEMKRVALIEFVAPMGFDARTVLVVRAAGNEAISTGTQAAASPTRWKIGMSEEFQNRATGLPTLNTYHLEMGAPPRSMKEEDLFAALDDPKNPVTLVAVPQTDGHLTQPQWKVLQDDQRAFPPYEAAILVRDDVLAATPDLRAALNQLTGKIDLAAMRRMNAAVVLEEKPIAEVASAFLKSAGLD